MASPILRLATRLTRRTRTTAWAIAFASMVLVGSLALMDGLRAGADSIAGRLETGPAVYIQGSDLLASRIPSDALGALPVGTVILRVHVGSLEMNGSSWDVVVASVARTTEAGPSAEYPVSSSDIAIDEGLRTRIEDETGRPLGAFANLSVFGATAEGLRVVPPSPVLPSLVPETWAWVRPELLAAMDAGEGGSVQALVSEDLLDPSLVASLGLSRLEAIGAIAFFRGSVDEAASALTTLAFLVAVVIGLLVYSAMSLEVHGRAAEIRTLRSLGARPAHVAAIYEGQALTLALLGAGLGSALGIVVAHAIVSFAPIIGLPNVVLLGPPGTPVLLAFLAAVVAAAVAGIVPSRRAASLSRAARGVGRS